MVVNKYDFAFIGGDTRQIYMINELSSLGYSIIQYGLTSPVLHSECTISNDMREVLTCCKVIITPIPFSKDGIHIITNTPLTIKIEDLLDSLTKEHTIFGGCFNSHTRKVFHSKGVSYYDFMESEEITLYNSIATAEGTIAKAIVSSTINLHDSKVLILGFGKCAKTLAAKLHSLSSHITIAARSNTQLAESFTSSFNSLPLSELESAIEQYDFIFNTIPSLILTKSILDKTKSSVVIIDIASHPGGVDFSYAKEINRYAELYLGIPGKVSPKSSAAFLNNYLLNQLRKK